MEEIACSLVMPTEMCRANAATSGQLWKLGPVSNPAGFRDRASDDTDATSSVGNTFWSELEDRLRPCVGQRPLPLPAHAL
jgi:hypothetical protein